MQQNPIKKFVKTFRPTICSISDAFSISQSSKLLHIILSYEKNFQIKLKDTMWIRDLDIEVKDTICIGDLDKLYLNESLI